MKRIGKLNNKIVVQGDPNLVKSNQILYKEDSNGIVLQERKNNNLENITAGGGGSEIKHHYYKFTTPVTESLLGDGFQYLLPAIGTLKLSLRDSYIFKTYVGLGQGGDIGVTPADMVAFEFIPVTEGYIYLEFRLAKDLKDYQYLYSLHDSDTAPKMDAIIDNVIEITEEEFYNIKPE